MLRPVLVQNGRARCRFVGQHTASGTFGELGEQLRRKPIGIGREWPLENDPTQLPVPCRAVLAGTGRLTHAPGSLRTHLGRETSQWSTATQTSSLEARKVQTADSLGHVAEGVAASVTVARGIVCRTNAETIQDDDGSAAHHAFGIVWT